MLWDEIPSPEPQEDIKKKDTLNTMECRQGLELLRKYYPSLWERIDEQDISKIIELSHAMFKTRPDLLEATTNPRYLSYQ